MKIPADSPLYSIADFLIGNEELLKHYEDKIEFLEDEKTVFKRTIVHLNGLTPPGVDPDAMDPDLCVLQFLINRIPNETLELCKVQRQLDKNSKMMSTLMSQSLKSTLPINLKNNVHMNINEVK